MTTLQNNEMDMDMGLDFEPDAMDYTFNQPFSLCFDEQEVFLGDQVIRIVPKRRLVAFGFWRGKEVVAKIFFDSQHAKRHVEKEIAGIQMLQKNKIPSPALLHQGMTADKRIHVLILERILYSQDVEKIWKEKENIQDVMPVLKAITIEIATQHVLGLMQKDLHLKNFLVDDRTIYTLDGGQIESFPELLSKEMSMNNLALFLSQISGEGEACQKILFEHYAHARGWHIKKQDYFEIVVLIKKWNELRWKKFQKKIFRNCSAFICFKSWRELYVYNRQYEGTELNQLLKNPDSAFIHKTGKILKSGNSSTVVKVTLDGRDYVVKRYNIKSFWHRLRRCLRPTRAATTWLLAHKLALFGISIAKPVAFIERRCIKFRGVSYAISEFVSGENLGDYFNDKYENNQEQREKTEHMTAGSTDKMIKSICELLKALANIEVTHGDLKISNILIDKTKKPVLIDLDGAAEHLTLNSLQQSWQKELARFLKNFNLNPSLQKKFETEFRKW